MIGLALDIRPRRARPIQARKGADNKSWTVDIGAAIYDTVCSETGEKNWHDS